MLPLSLIQPGMSCLSPIIRERPAAAPASFATLSRIHPEVAAFLDFVRTGQSVNPFHSSNRHVENLWHLISSSSPDTSWHIGGGSEDGRPVSTIIRFVLCWNHLLILAVADNTRVILLRIRSGELMHMFYIDMMEHKGAYMRLSVVAIEHIL
jgi:hypothetical protein